MKRDYYEILGISKPSNEKEIKTAFRRAAKQWHPDVNDSPEAEEKFKEIQEAYAILSDSEKKQMYDQYGHQAFEQGGAGNGFGGFDFSGFGGFDDIFSSFFGGGGGQSRSSVRRGSDLRTRVNISFSDSAKGITKVIKGKVSKICSHCNGSGAENPSDVSTCSTCNGSGTVIRQQQTIFGISQTRTECPTCHGSGKQVKNKCHKCNGSGYETTTEEISISIPAGIADGQTLRVAGKGGPGVNGGPVGDLLVTIHVEEHELFHRRGDDVFIEMPITFSQAALGADLEVPTIYGKVSLKIPEGTQSQTKFKLRDKGFKSLNSNHKGDQFVIVKVITPKKLSKEQKELFQKLSKTNEKSESFFDKIKNFF